jgi:Cysteine-rich secretory protein family
MDVKRALILALALVAAPAFAQPTAGVLAVHNRERGLVGVAPLAWDAGLAREAAAYALVLARLGRLEHSPPASRPGEGENLAMGTSGAYSAAALAALWAGEKSNFVNGVFPAVSRTGNWTAVGHYSQMIWRATQRVGCGTASGGGNLYLVCRYAPFGNVYGQRVY